MGCLFEGGVDFGSGQAFRLQELYALCQGGCLCLWVGEEGDGVVDEVLTGHDPAKAVSKIYTTHQQHERHVSVGSVQGRLVSSGIPSYVPPPPALPSSNLALSRLQWLPTVRVETFPHSHFWSALF